MLSSVWFWLAVAVLVFWSLGAYNRLVRLRAQVLRQMQSLALLWQAQAIGVRERIREMAHVEDTESQWATLSDEAARWRAVVQSARQLEAVLARVIAQPQQLLPPDDASALRAAHGVLQTSWQRLLEAQEDLAGHVVPDQLVQLWARQQELSVAEQAAYNRAALAYQRAVGQFPAIVLAWIFGFAPSVQM